MTASERLRAWALVAALTGLALFLTAAGDVRRLGVAFALLAGLLLLASSSARRHEEAADALPQAVLAHWTLLPSDWAAFVAREREGLPWLVAKAAGFLGALGLLDALPRGRSGPFLVALGLSSLGALFGAGLWALRSGALDALLEGPPSVTLTARHARIGAGTIAWTERPGLLAGGFVVREVRLEVGPVPVLVLALTWRSFGLPNPLLSRKVRLPVPPGDEAEAEAAAARLLAHLKLHDARRGSPPSRLSA